MRVDACRDCGLSFGHRGRGRTVGGGFFRVSRAAGTGALRVYASTPVYDSDFCMMCVNCERGLPVSTALVNVCCTVSLVGVHRFHVRHTAWYNGIAGFYNLVL